MKLIFSALFYIVLLGCQKSSHMPNASSPENPPATKTPANIGETEARTLISNLVNAQLKDETYVDASGKSQPYPEFRPHDWRVVEMKDERWLAKFDPPAGVWVTASVDAKGGTPRLEDYGFAAE